MQPSTSAASGNAPIVKMGHTTNGRNGSDAGKRIIAKAEPRDLEIKTSK
jgi:hypothetical protein